MSFIYRREMTITHADFFRLLPRALGSENFSREGNEMEYREGSFTMQISVSPQQSWRIGALSLPKTQVVIRMSGCDKQEVQQRIKQFDQAYQKGGG